MVPTGLVESFVAAIQASISVLLVIFYGGLAAKLKLLDAGNTKAISKTCVRIFLPALLLTKIGSQLEVQSASRYAIVLFWALACHVVSFLIGIFAHLVLGMPDWTTVAVMFNNTLSYPLLLIGALDETGILKSLVVGDETAAAAIERAKSYFLVFATVSSCLTFAVGPRLIDSEHAPEDASGDDDDCSIGTHVDGVEEEEAHERTALLTPEASGVSANPSLSKSFFPSTRKPLKRYKKRRTRRPPFISTKQWTNLGSRTQSWALLITDFFNAPLIGAILGAIIGLVPALHNAFFNDTNNGGIFTAWLTASLKNIGALFVPLPVVVAGVSLYTSMGEARDNPQAQGARLPKMAVVFILLVRFVVWPAMSIAVIYAFASKTGILGDDPMLWFAMMLMPTGPPAMKLITLVQVSEADDGEEASIAKLLTISYLLSPILSFAVVGGLVASQACI